MKNVKIRRKGRGFTLVELVIVIAVIAVLSAVLIPVFGNVVSNAKATALKANLKTFNEQLIVRSLNTDNRSSYFPEEIKQIASDLDLDLSNTPKGYSLWYDSETNNVRLFKNDVAFSQKDPSTAVSGVTQVYAANDEVQKGGRPIEALNPYNSKLYYIDETNKTVSDLIKEIKYGANNNGGIVVQAEDNGGNPAAISAAIVSGYSTKLNALAKAFGTDGRDLVQSFDLENTLFIGKSGMYLPSFDGAAGNNAPTVTCKNSFVDGTVTAISSQKLDTSTKKATNITVEVKITLTAKVTYVEGSAFSALGENSTSVIHIEMDSSTVFNSTGNTGANVVSNQYSSVIDAGSIQFANANIVFGRDYNCEYPTDSQYFCYTDSGIVSGKLTESQTLSDVGSGARVKYLVPVFNILNNGDGFFKDVTSISRLNITSNKFGNLVKYVAVVVLSEGDLVKGYKFSNIGYATNLNAHNYESYNPINHTGKTTAFPKGKGRIEIKLPEGATTLSNYKDRLSVKVNYKPVVNNYAQTLLKDGTIYYALSGDPSVYPGVLSSEAQLTDGKFVLEFDCPESMTMGSYSTLTSQIESVEVYYTPDLSKPADKKLILVRSYN